MPAPHFRQRLNEAGARHAEVLKQLHKVVEALESGSVAAVDEAIVQANVLTALYTEVSEAVSADLERAADALKRARLQKTGVA